MEEMKILEELQGVLLGGAVGDALGLTREMLSAERMVKLYGKPPLHHQFIGHFGMLSDDTEHACMVAESLLKEDVDVRRFSSIFAWKLRWWLLFLPAGVGSATARSLLKLWIGFPPSKSGVFSAGNGPAMKAAILGAYFFQDEKRLKSFIEATTRITHTDPKAYEGALVIALAAAQAIQQGKNIDTELFFQKLEKNIEGEDLKNSLKKVQEFVKEGKELKDLLEALQFKNGISGYINQTVPGVIFCWLRYRDDFRKAIETIIMAGGDTDTTAAILGGVMGATLGVKAIPEEWLSHIIDYPRSISYIRKLAEFLAQKWLEKKSATIGPFWPASIPRNLFFFIVVLFHGFRRLFPPY